MPIRAQNLLRSRRTDGAVLASLLLAGAATSLQAAVTLGTLGFADIGAPTTNTGNINTGTTFVIGNLLSTGATSGYFSGMPTNIFGSVGFDVSLGSSLSFSAPQFGSFSSSSITETSNVAGSRSFYVLGDFTGGTFGGPTAPNPTSASFTISFTQTPAGTGSISNSATLSIPPTPSPLSSTPEPGSAMINALAGIAGIALVGRRRR